MPMIDTEILKPVCDLYIQAQEDWYNYDLALSSAEAEGTPEEQAEWSAKVDKARKELDIAAMQVADEVRQAIYMAECHIAKV